MISVIVPVYNVEDYLPRCLESISAQTYKDIEVIIVDDGSTDSSGKICDEFCKKDSRFRVIHQKNQWLSGARNTGLKHAKGEYVYFLDSDDYIHIKTLEILHNAFIDGYDLAMIDFKETESIYENIYEDITIHNLEKTDIDGGRFFIESLFFGSQIDQCRIAVVWNKLYSKTLIENVYFNNIFGCEDNDFNYRVYLKLHKAIYINKKLHFYLQRPGSIVNNKDIWNERILNFLKSNYNMLHYTEKNNSSFRGLALRKLYKRILTTRFLLRNSSQKSEASKLYKRIYSETKAEFFSHKEIHIKEKIVFYILWHFPLLMTMYMKYKGN